MLCWCSAVCGFVWCWCCGCIGVTNALSARASASSSLMWRCVGLASSTTTGIDCAPRRCARRRRASARPQFQCARLVVTFLCAQSCKYMRCVHLPRRRAKDRSDELKDIYKIYFPRKLWTEASASIHLNHATTHNMCV